MPSRPSVGHLREDAAVEAVRAIEIADARRHLAARPFADRLLEQTLLVGQLEVQHQAIDDARHVEPQRGRLAEEHLAHRAFQQELFGDPQRLEHPLDVAIRQRLQPCRAQPDTAGAADCAAIDDDIPRVPRLRAGLRLGGVEEREQRAVRAQNPRQLLRQRRRRRLVEIVEQIPAQDAVDAAGLLRKTPARRDAGRSSSLPSTRLAIDVLRQILDEDLAAELLAEEVTLEPTTGPRSSSSGCCVPLASRGISAAPWSDAPARWTRRCRIRVSLRRRENRSERPTRGTATG